MGPHPPSPGPPDVPVALVGGALLAGRYRLEWPLASGGMAQVWRGRDEGLGRPVAIKVLHAHLLGDTSLVTRFRAEALAAARLAHPSVVAVYDTLSEPGVEAIVMELVDGTTLRAHLDDRRRLDAREAARIGAAIADALVVAHAASIVHRDIKPANVLLARDGRVLVTDFGIAKAAEVGDITGTHQMLGTAKYLAPEQVRAQRVDGRSDVYALGVVLFEMVCGQVPFLADSDAATALARLQADPPSPTALRPDLDPSFAQTILRALARRPEDRWPDAASLGVALRAIAAGRSAFVPSALPSRFPSPPPSPSPSPGPSPVASRGASPAPPTSPPVASPPPRPDPRVPAPGSVPARDWRSPDPSEAGPRRSRAPLVAAAALIATAGLLLVVLVARALGDDVTTVRPEATAFDPFGTEGENDDDAPLAVDDDPDTAWRSETYDDPDITVLKPGVGLVLELDDPATVQGVDVRSSSSGWTAEVYVLDDLPDGDQAEWGDPAGETEDAPGDARIDLGGTDGRVVLLWFTRTGDDGVIAVDEVRVEIS